MEKYKVIERLKDTGSTYSLLSKGMVPGIIYGKGTEPTKIAFENKALQKLMHSGSFYSTILDIEIEGKIEKILPKQLQYHPVTDKLIHFDFLRVQNDTKVTVEVPVQFLNQDTCPGLKKGGVLNLVRRDVELSCNAINIPDNLKFDLGSSEIGDSIKISNIDLPEGVTPTISDRDFVIATLAPPTVEVETKPTEAEETSAEESKDEKAEESKEESKEESN
jgi:large subunit ribosomal protein L25